MGHHMWLRERIMRSMSWSVSESIMAVRLCVALEVFRKHVDLSTNGPEALSKLLECNEWN